MSWFDEWIIKNSYWNSWAVLFVLLLIIVVPALLWAFREDLKKQR